MSWQKDLNDIAKRHHVRVWKQPRTGKGARCGSGRRTRDVELAYLRPGQALTHRIAANVDEEREKSWTISPSQLASSEWIGGTAPVFLTPPVTAPVI